MRKFYVKLSMKYINRVDFNEFTIDLDANVFDCISSNGYKPIR